MCNQTEYRLVKVVVVIGMTKDSRHQASFVAEHKKHCDMIQFNFVDDYYKSWNEGSYRFKFFLTPIK